MISRYIKIATLCIQIPYELEKIKRDLAKLISILHLYIRFLLLEVFEKYLKSIRGNSRLICLQNVPCSETVKPFS